MCNGNCTCGKDKQPGKPSQLPTFDELIWPQPTNRRQKLELERPGPGANFEDSKWPLIALLTFDAIMLLGIAVALVHITSWFIL